MFDLTYFQSRVEQAVGLLHRDLEVGAGGLAGYADRKFRQRLNTQRSIRPSAHQVETGRCVLTMRPAALRASKAAIRASMSRSSASRSGLRQFNHPSAFTL